MKKWIVLLLISLALIGCTPAVAPPETTVPTEPTHTEPVWTGYSSTSKGYIYLHSEERDHNWEEDILYFAGTYLDNYSLLTHFPSRVEYIDDVEYEDYLYDPEMRETFIEEINALIPRIPELSDTEILYELQRIVALLRDAHASLIIDNGTYFPICFEPFYEEDQWVYRVSFILDGNDDAVMCTLSGINGIPVDEVIRRIKPYLSYENEQWVAHLISGYYHPGSISEAELLRVCDIIGPDDTDATYNLITETGEKVDVTLRSFNIDQIPHLEMSGMPHLFVYPYIYRYYEIAYFYEMHPEDNMVYVRVNELSIISDYTFLDMGNEIIADVRDAGGVEKIIIDLRRNPGGYKFLGYPEFIRALERIEIEEIYVLVDQGTFSCAILMADHIKYYFPEAIIIGTPAGQPPNFYGGVWSEDRIMPNCQVECRLPSAYHNIFPDYQYDALMPDLIVYPTFSDYMAGIDTILETAKAQ